MPANMCVVTVLFTCFSSGPPIPSCLPLGLTLWIVMPSSGSNFQPLSFCCLFPLGCEMFSVFPTFAFLIFTNDPFVKSSVHATLLIVLNLLTAFNAFFSFSSPRIFGFWKGWSCFWFSCCFSSFIHSLLLEFSSGSTASLFSHTLASGFMRSLGFYHHLCAMPPPHWPPPRSLPCSVAWCLAYAGYHVYLKAS